MNITCVATSAVVPSNRSHWERLVELHPDADVTLICPAEYRTDRYGDTQTYRVQPEDWGDLRLRPIKTTKNREVYRSLTLGLRNPRPDILQVNKEPDNWDLHQWLTAGRVFAPQAVRLFYFEKLLATQPARLDRRLKNRYAFRMAQALVPTAAAERALRELGYEGSVHLIPYQGRDERVWFPGPAHRRDKFIIGFSGALRLQKGIVNLAHAVAGLRGDWRLQVAGDGPDRPAMEAILQEAGVRDRADFLGLIERDELPEIVRSWDVIVLPSRNAFGWHGEQFPMALIEGMLCRVAVVGSDSGGIPELIGDAGLVCREEDWRSLREQLQNLMDNPGLLRQMADRGYERALRLYSRTAVAEQTYSLFERLLEGSTGSPSR